MAMAVGTPASAMTSLANAFEASSCAAALLGPNTGIPASRTASETPAASGASGPTTTRSTASLVASAATASGSLPLMLYVGTSLLMPALPGAAWTSDTLGSASRERTMACSRPPGPMTSTFTVTKGTLWTLPAPKL
ncbi:exonuclease VII large subunit [Arthrobacter nitrophenolicus]|uniref:Exonuclease VII large subunit n=1 Tax=Arthrobacter nitrophenolicus TaxID=683150 RepID=L8TMK8_9MICC|nr:exonuclease VII large subunit [Arthrobacter nitrophenolicus]